MLLLEFPSTHQAQTDLEAADVKKWDILNRNFEVKGDEDTVYWCWMVKVKQVLRTIRSRDHYFVVQAPVSTKHHVIAMEPIIQVKF